MSFFARNPLDHAKNRLFCRRGFHPWEFIPFQAFYYEVHRALEFPIIIRTAKIHTIHKNSRNESEWQGKSVHVFDREWRQTSLGDGILGIVTLEQGALISESSILHVRSVYATKWRNLPKYLWPTTNAILDMARFGCLIFFPLPLRYEWKLVIRYPHTFDTDTGTGNIYYTLYVWKCEEFRLFFI